VPEDHSLHIRLETLIRPWLNTVETNSPDEIAPEPLTIGIGGFVLYRADDTATAPRLLDAIAIANGRLAD